MRNMEMKKPNYSISNRKKRNKKELQQDNTMIEATELIMEVEVIMAVEEVIEVTEETEVIEVTEVVTAVAREATTIKETIETIGDKVVIDTTKENPNQKNKRRRLSKWVSTVSTLVRDQPSSIPRRRMTKRLRRNLL